MTVRRRRPSERLLRTGAGKPIAEIADALTLAGDRPLVSADSVSKKNYAEKFSRAVAACIANRLRPLFPGITPDEYGLQQEAPARTAKGFKKLDVNYSTSALGLALGVSVKSINFPDWSSREKKAKRFTKNYSRNDNELRAEAVDYHQRQPYSVLVGVLFLPRSSCTDAALVRKDEEKVSSFGAAVKFFRPRSGRQSPRNEMDLFERFFIAVYDEANGDTCFFDVMSPPPKNRSLRPEECLSFEQFIQEIIKTYNERNDPPFRWAD